MAPVVQVVDQPPLVREQQQHLLEEMAAAFIAGPLGPLDRWIDAWVVVAHAFKLEGDHGNAKTCEDMAVTLLHWQRTGIMPASVLP